MTDIPDDQKIQKDYPDTRRTQKDIPGDQKPPEDQEDYEDLSGSRPSVIEYLLGIACIAIYLPYSLFPILDMN